MDLPIERSKLFGSNNKLRTQTLFWEHKYSDPDGNVVFTTSNDDLTKGSKTYISLKKIFLEVGDPTEYEFALKVFGEWDIWDRIKKSRLVAGELKKWHIELRIKQRSEQLLKISEIALDNKASASARYQASKFLYEEANITTEPSKRGRPSKEEVEGELKAQARISEQVRRDMKRLGLKVVA